MVDTHAAELLVVQAQARCAFPSLHVANQNHNRFVQYPGTVPGMSM